MSVKVRPYRRGGWEVDVRVLLPDGRERRERKERRCRRESARLRWGEARERELADSRRPETPEGGAHTRGVRGAVSRRLRAGEPTEAERDRRQGDDPQRPSRPAARAKKLDAITNEDVQRLKHRLQTKAPKTVNNVLTVLNMLLKTAVEWDVIDRMPCTIRLLPTPKTSAGFHDFDEYERLVRRRRLDRRTAYLIVLLGGEAGLRCGEMMALEWSDVDLEKRQLRDRAVRLERSRDGDEGRAAPLRAADDAVGGGAAAASAPARRRVLVQRDGQPLTQKIVQVSFDERRARRTCKDGRARAAAHVLFALGDAGRAGARDSGARRASGLDDDAAIHAPQSGGDRRRDSAPRSAGDHTFWRHSGDGKERNRQVERVEQLKWWRRRESVCHDRRILE